MLQSKLFGKTLKSAPKDADSVNAALLIQAGYIHKVAAGIYEFLPLGLRVLSKINEIIRREMNAIGGQEVNMPILHPMHYYELTGRDKTFGDILFKTEGHAGSEFTMGPSHEEIVTPLAAKYVQSYKDLPFALYQIQLKFRNEARAKSGLLRGREFGMKDMYSFHATQESLDEFYEKCKKAYSNVYEKCGLDALIVEAGGGAFSDDLSHEFQVACEYGEDTILLDKKGRAQNVEVVNQLHQSINPDEKEGELKKVKIEHGSSVEENAKAHDVDQWRILKTVVLRLETGGYIGVCLRGDLTISIRKLEKYLETKVFPASTKELEKLGLVEGYISPVDNSKLDYIGDLSLSTVKNFVTGANEEGLDYLNVNLGREFQVKGLVHISDISEMSDLEEIKAIEAGNIFKLGTKYSKPVGLQFTDKDGSKKDVIMGCYGIGTTRLMGTIAEVHNDDNGLIWPKNVSPYQVHLLHLGKDEDVILAAKKLYEDLITAGYEVLYDDRNIGPGAKFADSDLLGLPVRIVIGNKTIAEQSCEFKLRSESKVTIMKLEKVINELNEFYEN